MRLELDIILHRQARRCKTNLRANMDKRPNLSVATGGRLSSSTVVRTN